jgi:Flp pilus assembly protein TadG
MYSRTPNRSVLRRHARKRAADGRRRGVAAVEFAIVAPIFFMLIIGMIEIGRATMVQQILVNASRVGARTACTTSSTQQAAIDEATDYAEGVGVNGVTATCSPNPATAAAGTAITVTTSVPYSSVSWLPIAKFMGGRTLSASSVMRKEGF